MTQDETRWSYEKLVEAFDELYSRYSLEYNAEREEEWDGILEAAGWTDEEFLVEVESGIA